MKKKGLIAILLTLCMAALFACTVTESEKNYEIIGVDEAIYLSTEATTYDFSIRNSKVCTANCSRGP